MKSQKQIDKEADKTPLKPFERRIKMTILAYNDDDADEQMEDMMGECWTDGWCEVDDRGLEK